MDDAVARLFDALSATGELDNTIVLYLSDNGYSLGSHRNLQKDCPYEECIRASAPRSLARDGDGPASELTRQQHRHRSNYRGDDRGLGPVSGRWREPRPTAQWPADDTRPTSTVQHVYYPGTAPSFWGIRTERWMYALYETGERELFAVDRDPYELRNLAGRPSYRDRERKLRADMQELRR